VTFLSLNLLFCVRVYFFVTVILIYHWHEIWMKEISISTKNISNIYATFVSFVLLYIHPWNEYKKYIMQHNINPCCNFTCCLLILIYYCICYPRENDNNIFWCRIIQVFYYNQLNDVIVWFLVKNKTYLISFEY
jgi:hypothetical protein